MLAGDYYVDNTKNCIVKYIEDDFQDDGISDKVRTVSIQPGETVEIKALKYAGLPYKWKDKEEMYNMNCNVFSISENVIVSENNFIRLNEWLISKEFTVEKINYSEIAKQEGLLRCSTMPLIRKQSNFE